jgi:4'-phosphopantetheinyl transferase EntD
LQALAGAVRLASPDTAVEAMTEARFTRFLNLAPDQDIQAFCRLAPAENGLAATLLTRVTSKSGVSRTLEHARAVFGDPRPAPMPPPVDALIPEGPALIFPAERLYEELVPFGPAFCNLTGDVHLSRGGGSAWAKAPDFPHAQNPLGSPFPVDAGFHLASAWAQRFQRTAAMPLRFDRRIIFSPLTAGETCFCRAFPQAAINGGVRFDLWLFDSRGAPREAVLGLILADLTRGALRPPDWVGRGEPDLSALGEYAAGPVVLEIASLPPAPEKALTPREEARAGRLGPRRLPGYLAGRMALKQAARLAGLADQYAPADQVDTISPDDDLRPELAGGYQCSLSHDKRLAAAVADPRPIGVDVEALTDRAYRGRRLFLNNEEFGLVEAGPHAPEEAALRVWSIKEAASKALNLPLARAWREATVVSLTPDGGLCLAGGKVLGVRQAMIDDHLMTVVVQDGE